LAKAPFAINSVPLAEANGNETAKFIAVPFMGRINKQESKALAKNLDKRVGAPSVR